METIVYKISETEEQIWLKAAGDILAAGGLVGIPTETVYGLAANALDAEAAAKIYAAKGRPSDNPLIAYFRYIHAESLVSEIPDAAETGGKILADR
ncbi:MAG: Sua5/YciO/YrdC/YwlC family protein [Frisingicoccus sp.]